MAERIDTVGYINDDHEHVLLGFRDPALLNPSFPPENWVQVAVTIETATALHVSLGKFLDDHNRTLN